MASHVMFAVATAACLVAMSLQGCSPCGSTMTPPPEVLTRVAACIGDRHWDYRSNPGVCVEGGITKVMTHGGMQYATLDNADPHAGSGYDENTWSNDCCNGPSHPLPVPSGWEIVPNISVVDAKLVIAVGDPQTMGQRLSYHHHEHWGTGCLVLGDGSSWETETGDNWLEGGALVKNGDLYYTTGNYMQRILIQRPAPSEYSLAEIETEDVVKRYDYMLGIAVVLVAAVVSVMGRCALTARAIDSDLTTNLIS
eukprot:TRINITY_DN33539_c0_g1_i1.p1 TRINITY_DN33539_c0_g1~~TRINITY_DN33539_c0_g1_i1.p1  ORF type:complete len:262 (+),score=17.04 TRINITY_DN33539_c0_g1_i1:29-787(+)